MKADHAVKRMCKDEKHHEHVGQKIHREARTQVLGKKKITLVLNSCTYYLFTFRQTNDVIILISEKQVLRVRASSAPCPGQQGSGRRGKRGLHTRMLSLVPFLVELHSLNGSAALIFFNMRAQQRTHLFFSGFMTKQHALACLSFGLFWGWVGGVVCMLHNAFIYIICVD